MLFQKGFHFQWINCQEKKKPKKSPQKPGIDLIYSKIGSGSCKLSKFISILGSLPVEMVGCGCPNELLHKSDTT